MDSYKLAVKFFIEDASALPVEDFVPVFHRWIQSRALPDHQLIDVADYGHVHEGPGTVLISHEANIHADLGGGRLGLMYVRKQPLPGTLRERLRAVFGHALRAAVLLEEEPSMKDRVRFRTDEAVFRIHDRLLAPNTQETFEQVRAELGLFLRNLYAAPSIELSYHPHPENLFEAGIQAPKSVPVSTLLERAGK